MHHSKVVSVPTLTCSLPQNKSSVDEKQATFSINLGAGMNEISNYDNCVKFNMISKNFRLHDAHFSFKSMGFDLLTRPNILSIQKKKN